MSGPEPKAWITAITPYAPGRAKTASGKTAIKLSANENPLGASPDASAALADARNTLARYPDPQSTALREAIGETYDLDPAHIVCGTGSDELLHLAAGAYASIGDEVLYSRFGFSVYPLAAQRVRAVIAAISASTSVA